MSSERNKHGLSRPIPDSVRRQVRQECGFGCVVCGSAIFDYHHMDEFVDVAEHDPKKIACLCGGCHRMVDRGWFSKGKIEEARANPTCKQIGYSCSEFDVGSNYFNVTFGAARFINPQTVLRVCEQDLLAIRGSEEPGGPLRVSGRFYDRDSKLIFTIDDNEWTGPVDNWDIETEGSKITIRRDHGDIALKLTVVPRSCVIVERLDMYYDGVRIYADKEGVSAGQPGIIAHGFRGEIVSAQCCVSVSRGPDGRDFCLRVGTGAAYTRGGLFSRPRSPQGDK